MLRWMHDNKRFSVVYGIKGITQSQHCNNENNDNNDNMMHASMWFK